MDAATTRITTRSFLLAAALIAAAAPARAQLQVNGSSTTSVTPSNLQSSTVTVSSTTTGSINYNVAWSSSWFNVENGNGTVISSGAALSTANTAGQALTIFLGAAPLSATSGTITLTDIANPSSDVATIQVNYTPGSGGGTGIVTANTTQVTLTTSPYSSQLAQSTAITLSTASTTAITGTITLTNSSYMTLSQSYSTGGTSLGFQVSSASPFTFYVIGPAYTPAGSYSGTLLVTPSSSSNASLTIPVSYISTTGTAASPSSFTLYYPGSPSSQVITVATPGTSYYAYTNSSWLLLNNNYYSSGSIVAGQTFTVSVNPTYAANTAGGTQGNVTVTGSDGTSSVLTVTLNVSGTSSVTATPSSVTINVASGTSSQQGSVVELTTPYSGITYSVGWSTSNNTGSWLSVSPSYGTLTGSNANNPLNVYVSPYGLSNGTYYGTITITFSGSGISTTTTQIPVTMVIGGGTTGAGGLVAPASLNFVSQVGAAQANLDAYSYLLVNTNGSWSTSVAYTSSSSQQWLSVAPSGSGSSSILVQVNSSGLSAATYSANITVITSGGSAVVPVNLVVSNTMVAATSPAAYVVSNYTVGSGSMAGTNVYVYTSDNSAQSFTVASSASWITTSCSNMTTVGSCLLQLDPSSLPNGLNSGNVTFTVNGASDSTFVLPVAIIVSGSTVTGGALNFSASSLAFNTTVGGSPASQTLTVSSSSASSFYVNASSAGNWLSVSPANQSLSLPYNVIVSVNTSGLSANSYTGSLNFTANGVTQTLPVTLSVGSGVTNLTPSPTSLSFTYSVGGSVVPSSGTIAVSGTNGASVPFTASATTSAGGSWISLNSTNFSGTPSNVVVTLNPTGLTAGNYNGTITLTSTGGSVNVPISLAVSATTPISATPTSLSFAYTAGGSTPASQTVTVNGTGAFSATAASSWLSVTPGSGTAPSALSVSVNASGLAAGSYNGTISVAGTGSATGSTTVSVTLVVTVLPTITKITNAASYAVGAISPGEIITLFGTGLGPTPPVPLTTLTSAGTVGTTLGNVQVLVNGYACPMLYASATQISAVVPYEVAIFQTASVFVNYLGTTSNAVTETVTTTAPGIFTANSSGTGPGAISNQNGSANSPANPAAKGSVVTLYLTGEGQTSPKGVTGSVTQAVTTVPYTPAPLLPVAVLINNSPVSVQFYGEAPTEVAGVLQINVLIPANAASGNLPVQVSIGPNNTQTNVTVSVQ